VERDVGVSPCNGGLVISSGVRNSRNSTYYSMESLSDYIRILNIRRRRFLHKLQVPRPLAPHSRIHNPNLLRFLLTKRTLLLQ